GQEEGAAAAEQEHLPGDPRGSRGDEEPNAVGDVLGTSETPQRDPLDEAPLPFLAVAFPLPLGRWIRADDAGRDAVHRDSVRSKLVGRLARVAAMSVIRDRVGLDDVLADAVPPHSGYVLY